MSGVELTEFVLARISDDEASDGWHTVDCGVDLGYWATGVCTCGYPARVLAECAAKRALVVMCQPDPLEAQLRALATTNPAAWNLVGPLVEQADKDRSVTLRLLALPYRDHPDYREEWRP